MFQNNKKNVSAVLGRWFVSIIEFQTARLGATLLKLLKVVHTNSNKTRLSCKYKVFSANGIDEFVDNNPAKKLIDGHHFFRFGSVKIEA